MILVCGIPTEAPLARVTAALESLGARFVVFNQRAFEDTRFAFTLDGAGLTGELRLGTSSYRVEDLTAAYTRLMDDTQLPELGDESADSPLRASCRALHEELSRWLEIVPARVVNRAAAMATNSSKPYRRS